MKITLEQKEKELFGASFYILKNEETIGNVLMKGKLGSYDLDVNADFNNKKIRMFCENKKLVYKDEYYRPYKILIDDKEYGEIYQTRFKKFLYSYDYIKLVNDKLEYESYGIGIGKKSEICVYLNNKQILQTEINGKTINNLCIYNTYFYDEKYDLEAVLLSIYMYIVGAYEPGEKVYESVETVYNKTTNKYLLEKYNENWIKNNTEWIKDNSNSNIKNEKFNKKYNVIKNDIKTRFKKMLLLILLCFVIMSLIVLIILLMIIK